MTTSIILVLFDSLGNASTDVPLLEFHDRIHSGGDLRLVNFPLSPSLARRIQSPSEWHSRAMLRASRLGSVHRTINCPSCFFWGGKEHEDCYSAGNGQNALEQLSTVLERWVS